MSANSWPESDSYNKLDDSLSLELAIPATSESDPLDIPAESGRGSSQGLVGDFGGRRWKAALVLVFIWSSTVAIHLLAWGTWVIWSVLAVMVVHALRILTAQAGQGQTQVTSKLGMVKDRPGSITTHPAHETDAIPKADTEDLPFMTLLVAAKNEAEVITRLVETLCALDYPSHLYELWVIDDISTDATPVLLDQLATQYPQLNVLHRTPPASGGKSGALNQVLPLTRGEILGVFDADAQVEENLLRAVVPLFAASRVGAVQVRKDIANASTNFWTQGQAAEMALDICFQQQRIAVKGIGELRGNGQFVRRSALEECGGWNEETITDDLDLTLRLQLLGWDIDCLLTPPVQEEGVTTMVSLWHQRNRWAEGGYQRYLDFWQPIVRNRLGTSKTLDMVLFWIIQYWLPNAAIPDALMAMARHRLPVYTPITFLALSLSCWGIFTGLRRVQPLPLGKTLQQTLLGIVYMMHWFVIVACVSARMSIRPKRLKWVKTVHSGAGV